MKIITKILTTCILLTTSALYAEDFKKTTFTCLVSETSYAEQLKEQGKEPNDEIGTEIEFLGYEPPLVVPDIRVYAEKNENEYLQRFLEYLRDYLTKPAEEIQDIMEYYPPKIRKEKMQFILEQDLIKQGKELVEKDSSVIIYGLAKFKGGYIVFHSISGVNRILSSSLIKEENKIYLTDTLHDELEISIVETDLQKQIFKE